jgi:chromate transport protein ChrA
MLDFILGIGELLVSRRLYVGLAVTAIICWMIVSLVPSQSLQLAICIPLGVAGLVASWRWQVRADIGK